MNGYHDTSSGTLVVAERAHAVLILVEKDVVSTVHGIHELLASLGEPHDVARRATSTAPLISK